MAFGPVIPAPPEYGLQTPRPDLKQAAGTLALTAVAPAVMVDPEPPVIDKALHARLVEGFEAAEDASRTNREKAERDVDFYDGKQWAVDEVKKLERRGQPAITLNMVRGKIDFLQGLERTQRTKPRALPRTRMHEEDAASIGDALKFVVDDNRYDQVRSKVWGDVLKAGWGGTELSIQEVRAPKGAPTKKIVVRRCQWDRMFWDPYSCEDDFSDASYLGMVLWMDRSEAVRRYGEAAGQVFDETIQIGQVGGTYDDKPKVTTWIQNGLRKRVRVVQMYRISDDTGEWEFWEFTKGGILKGGPSPWIDEEGNRVHPYEWTSAYVDRDNNRYGVIRDMVDPQMEFNKRRSKSLHHFTSRQTFATQRAQGPQSRDEMRRQLARPDGHLEFGDGEFGKDFGIIPTNDMAQGHLELMQQVVAFFETIGPNASMQGRSSKAQSGRAVLANQQGGAIQAGTLTDSLRDMDHRTYRKIWNTIRQFWTEETWVRVTDDEKNLRWVALNEPLYEAMQDPFTGQPVIDQTGQPVVRPAIDPETGMPARRNSVADLDLDIIVDDAPDLGTMIDEQFELLVQLKQMDVNNEIPFAAIIEAAPNLRNKDKILQGIEQAAEQRAQQAQQAIPLQEAAAQTEIENQKADTAQKASSAALNEAKAQATMLEGEAKALAALTPQPMPLQGF